MKIIQINKDEYEEWAKNQFVEYASCSVQYQSNISKRLVFGVFVNGGYLVKCGDEVLYEGGSFSSAQNTFNQIF